MRRALVLAVVSSGVLAGLMFAGSVFARPSFEPASPNEQPYLVDNISMQYPGIDAKHVDVTFDYSWARSTYPGPANCRVVIQDTVGDVVGTRDMELDSLQPAATADLEGAASVEVTGTRETAVVECAPSRAPDPSGQYSFDSLRFSQVEGQGVFLEGRVTWKGEGPPDTQQCALTFDLPSGEAMQVSFTFSVPNEHDLHMWLPGLTSVGQDPTVRCSPYPASTQPSSPEA
jgi:hypothetical protein